MSPTPQEDFRALPIPEMEARIAKFEARVNAAHHTQPPSKEWVKRALSGQGERCPVRIKRLSFDIILRHGDALADLFYAYPDDVVAVIPYDITIGYQAHEKTPRINTVEALMRDAQWHDEWGTQWGHAYEGVGATPIGHPIQDWSMLDDYLRTGIPDPLAPGRYAAAETLINQHRERKYCFGIIHLALFERLHALRGMENTFADFYTNETEVDRLLDALEQFLMALVQRWGDLGADAIFFTDDWGSQSGLMIAPELWRKFFKARYTRVFERTHQLGMQTIFHSCGNVIDIVGDLIDTGVDVLDPVQPGAMDIERLAREYGGKLAFCGAIDIQGALCSGTPQQVKDEIRRVRDILAKPFGGALMLGPANVMTPETPLENLAALFEATHES